MGGWLEGDKLTDTHHAGHGGAEQRAALPTWGSKERTFSVKRRTKERERGNELRKQEREGKSGESREEK